MQDNFFLQVVNGYKKNVTRQYNATFQLESNAVEFFKIKNAASAADAAANGHESAESSPRLDHRLRNLAQEFTPPQTVPDA